MSSLSVGYCYKVCKKGGHLSFLFFFILLVSIGGLLVPGTNKHNIVYVICKRDISHGTEQNSILAPLKKKYLLAGFHKAKA